MTEIAPHTPTPPTFLPRQDEYHRVTDLATRLSGTEFVPSALRGKPASVLAAMLVGREVGIGPMHALRSIHIIDGKPTLSAELLMALVLKAGHDLYVAESTRDRCEVRYRRREWPADRPDGVVVWTVEDAEDAGLSGKGVWTKYRRAMLRSRAVSEASRQGFPDVVEGMGYTAEELDEPDEAVVVETIGVTASEEDDLERRRALHSRAVAAYRRLADADAETGAAAWSAATAGLGPNLWTDADVAILETRVTDLERLAEEVPAPDDDEGGDPAVPDDTPPADDGGDVVDAEVVEDAPEPDAPAVGEAGACTHDGPRDTVDTRGAWRCRACGKVARPADDAPPFDTDDTPAEEEPVEDGERRRWYAGLNVTQVAEEIRGGTLTAEEAWALEVEAHDPPRKTVRGLVGEAAQDAPGAAEASPAGEDPTPTTNGAHAPTGAVHVPDGMPAAEQEYRRTVLKRYRTVYRAVWDVDRDAAGRLHALRLETVGADDGAALWVPRAEVERLEAGIATFAEDFAV